ncbi:AMP-binding protein [Moritella viscosa]|uniref:AMP-dependent synthetase/ligase domain-containing protein n=1 Tax=Moritella viscosa TaxID=80854 RepID=A0ABY1HEU1_9GAMM|nr:AMP-binding protein [Moritella viscosa]SGY93220.1 Tyrocidine synthase 3-Tyrocidine synthase III-ATP-dependent asparagine adenylase-Asparagine activase-ATP-dependent glutamine adenylase-Glutamine activase-ATP-dependent tyrosine adenylase-Tyrosine activase-ATP-dependent valine adenylase-Valine activase-ATP-dependent ornithine adenylase-Ornithine activase-ATP-dependent leucine adenylase-Leucine activase [Moritella viscosa]SGY98274.1 Tyrocidine synthase 3-Tyrocidine synthase III-ATP-dependent aspa
MSTLALNLNTPLDALLHWEKHRANEVYLRQPINGTFHEFTWSQVADQTKRIAQALQSLGLTPGDKIAILAKNSAEWFINDLAIMYAGYISVPIYSTANAKTINYVLEHSEAKVLFIGKLDNYQSLEGKLPADVITISYPYETLTCQYKWNDLLEQHQPLATPAHINLEDLMSIIYTSGSTGNPKGVMITFAAFKSASQNIVSSLGIIPGDRLLSYLPLAHITERVYIEGSSIYAGEGVVSFVESLDTFVSNIQSVEPTLFISVPRLWTRFQMGVLQKMPAHKLNFLLKIPFVNGLVRAKIKRGLGLQHARMLGCGSAAVSPSLLKWYERLGLNITEAWGMTENLAYGTLNHPFNSQKIGTIGKPGAGVDLKISEIGEILVKGDGLMSGYYKDEAQTKESFDEEGYFKTGDKGEIDSNGYVKITGRVKDIFKTSKGKYVTPVPIECKFGENPNIEQICITGTALTQPVALVVLSPEARELGQEAMTTNLEETRQHINKSLESHARIGHIIVLKDEWTVDNGLLTPTLKFKRHELESRFKPFYEENHQDKIVWEQ